MLLLAATGLVYFRMFLKTGNRLLYLFILGFLFVMSEFSFMLYKDVWDSYIWLWHLFQDSLLQPVFSRTGGFAQKGLTKEIYRA